MEDVHDTGAETRAPDHGPQKRGTPTHVGLLTAAVTAGKAVLREKPIDLDLARVDACWADIKGLDPR